MSEAPTGFALDRVYRQIVSDAAGEAVELAVCDDSQILMPAADELPEDCRAQIEALLAGLDADSSCREVPMDSPDDGPLRLVAVPHAAGFPSHGERSERLVRRTRKRLSLREPRLVAER